MAQSVHNFFTTVYMSDVPRCINTISRHERKTEYKARILKLNPISNPKFYRLGLEDFCLGFSVSPANVIILTSTLSISHSFPLLSIPFQQRDLLMMILDIATSAWLIAFCHKDI